MVYSFPMHRFGSLICALAVTLTACAEGETLTGLDGDAHRLTDYVGQGRWVMVNVWSPGCPHCLAELPALTAFHTRDPARAGVLGIAVQYPGFGYPDRAALAQIVLDNDIPFPVLMADGDAAGAFVGDVVDLVPLTFAYDPQGRMVARWHGVITLGDIDEIIQDFSGNGP